MKTITLSGRNYNLHPVTGKVLSTNKNLETKVSGSGGGGFNYRGTGATNRVKVTSKTTIHDQLFIEDQEGKEHSYQLQDFNLACRDGNLLTVLSAIQDGKSSGPYIAVINHSTDKVYYSKEAFKSVGGPNKFMLAGIFLVIVFLGFLLAGGTFFPIALLLLGVVASYYAYMHNKDVQKIKHAINPADYKLVWS